MMYFSQKKYEEIDLSNFIFEVEFPIFGPKMFIVHCAVKADQLGLMQRNQNSIKGPFTKYVTHFFDIFDPPSPHVTHFTKQAYRLMSPFGRPPSPLSAECFYI